MFGHPTIKSLSCYLDGDLSAPQQQKIAQHLRQCTRCRECVERLQEMEIILLPKKKLPEGLTEQFIDRLEKVERINTPSVAEVDALVGRVLVCRNGDYEEVEAFPGMTLKQGDTVRASGDSLALLKLNDGSSVYLNKGSRIQFSSGSYPLSLHDGELFAMMKPQRKVFEIKTPSAVLGVMGTDFDAQVTDKNATILKVLKGKVSFQNDAGKTVVKTRQQVEAPKHIHPTPTRIRETKAITNWTAPVRPQERKGGTAMKNLGFIIVVVALVIAGIWYFQKQEQAAAPQMVKLDKTDPLSLKSRYREPGASWRVRTVTQEQEGESWIDEGVFVTRSEILEVDPEKGSRVLVTIEELKLREGHQHEAETAQMVGRQFEYHIGEPNSLRVRDGKPLEGIEIAFFVLSFGASDFQGLFLKSRVVPGEEWSQHFEDGIPGYPNSFFKAETQFQFVGYELRDGIEVAVVRTYLKGSLGGGLPMGESIEGQITRRIMLDQLDFEGTGEYLLDTESGRIVSGEGTTKSTSLRGRMTLISPGQPTRELPHQEELDDLSRSFMTVEYLGVKEPGKDMKRREGMSDLEVRIVELEPMRVANVRVVSTSPEQEAWEKLRAWAEPKGLLEDLEKHPVFGFNNPPPSADRTEYGYEFWIRVEPDTKAEGEVEVKDFEGGLYAVTSCRLVGDPRGNFTEIWMQLLEWVRSSQYQWRKTHELEKLQNPGASEEEAVLELYLPIEE